MVKSSTQKRNVEYSILKSFLIFRLRQVQPMRFFKSKQFCKPIQSDIQFNPYLYSNLFFNRVRFILDQHVPMQIK